MNKITPLRGTEREHPDAGGDLDKFYFRLELGAWSYSKIYIIFQSGIKREAMATVSFTPTWEQVRMHP